MRSTHLGYWGRFIWVVVEVREAILEQNIQISQTESKYSRWLGGLPLLH